MKEISADTIREWINQCDSQLKRLQNTREFIKFQYYEKQSIDWSLEEDLLMVTGNLIGEHKAKKQLLEKMLIHCETENGVQMFDSFLKRIENRLPENMHKEFYNYVYEI
jgi:hypothetical protein